MSKYRTIGASAGLGLLLWGVTAGSVPAGNDTADLPDLGANVFFIDGLAVDMLEPEPAPASPFRSGMPRLTEGRPRLIRRRLLDAPEPVRDPESRREVARYMERAQQLAQRNQYDAALLEIRDALSLDPVNPAVLSRAATYATQARDYERAAGFFRRLVVVLPGEPELKAAYASILLRLARFEEAEAMLREAGRTIPDDLTVRFSRLCLDLLRERSEPAADYWKTRPTEQLFQIANWLKYDRDLWIRLMGPRDFRQLCEITLGADVYSRIDDIAAELERLQAALRAGQGHAMLPRLETLRALGVESLGLEAAQAEALFMDGQTDAALALWRSVILRAPEWMDAHFGYGFTLLRADRYADAVETFRVVRAHEDQPILRFLLAVALSLDGEQEEPRGLFTELVLSHPQQVRQWMESDSRFYRAMRRMDNFSNLLRYLGIPPELE